LANLSRSRVIANEGIWDHSCPDSEPNRYSPKPVTPLSNGGTWRAAAEWTNCTLEHAAVLQQSVREAQLPWPDARHPPDTLFALDVLLDAATAL
jgi:hypothetical protein